MRRMFDSCFIYPPSPIVTTQYLAPDEPARDRITRDDHAPNMPCLSPRRLRRQAQHLMGVMACHFHRGSPRHSSLRDRRQDHRHCLAAVRASGLSFAIAAVQKIVRQGPSVPDVDLTASRCLSLKPLVDPRSGSNKAAKRSEPPDDFALGAGLGGGPAI